MESTVGSDTKKSTQSIVTFHDETIREKRRNSENSRDWDEPEERTVKVQMKGASQVWLELSIFTVSSAKITPPSFETHFTLSNTFLVPDIWAEWMIK